MNQDTKRLTYRLESGLVFYLPQNGDKEVDFTSCGEHSQIILNRLAELEGKLQSKKPQPLKYKPLLEIGWKYSCPSCGCAIGMNSNCIDYTQEDVYCPTCGQRLDWSV